jgi:phosphopantothenoylcysteine decarboxylase/phosphopantothenate--cysteine ligase
MAAALAKSFEKATVLIMAAAVADYRRRRPAAQKVKTGPRTMALELERNPDILSGLAARKGRRTVVGFAAETQRMVDEARRKLREKKLDLIVGNDVTAPGAGFGSDTNVVQLIAADGEEAVLPVLPKDEVADRILDWVAKRRPARRRAGRGR